MKYIRAVEHGAVGEIGVCHLLYPDLANHVDNLYLVTGNLTSQLARVKAHAVELSRERALALLDEAAALATEGQTELAKRRRAKGARFLYRMAPGSCAKIGAIQTEEGTLVSDPQHMADVLRRHWAAVFSARGVDLDLLRKWVADDIAARTVENNLQEAMRGFRSKGNTWLRQFLVPTTVPQVQTVCPT